MSSLLPPNSTALELALEGTMATVTDLPIAIRDIHNPDTCPARLLPWLAWEYSVDAWNSAWTDEQKRGAIKASIDVHRRKGTVSAVRNAVGGFGFETQVVEWFRKTPMGDPYTFGLNVVMEQTGPGIENPTVYSEITRVALAAKNLRSRLTELSATLRASGEVHVGVALQTGVRMIVAAEPAE